jgi:glycosyltransferase involved in cell wall biosynthesis
MPAGAAVLWVTEEPPDRNLGGGSIRQSHLLSAVAERVPTALLIGGRLDDQRVRALLSSVVEVPVPQPFGVRSPTRRRIADLSRALGGTTREVQWHRPTRRALAPVLAELAPAARLVVLNNQSLLPLVPKRRAGLWAAELHHVSSEMARQELEGVGGRRQRWLVEREAAHAAAFERRVVEQFDIVSVCSDEDARLLGAPAARTVVTPNGVDLAHYPPAPLRPDHTVLLPASLNYLPNVEGARWFCHDVWGRVRERVPDAVLQLVGRAPVAEVLALEAIDGVSVHGDVEAMLPWMHGARVVVVPLRIGTGTRLKVVEAMASGRAVAGTTVGLAGLEIVDRRHALVADDEERLAAAVVELLLDDALAEALAAEGRRLVVERYAWDRLGAGFAGRLLELAGISAAA